MEVLDVLHGVSLGAEEGGKFVDVELVKLKFNFCTSLPRKEFSLSFARDPLLGFIEICSASSTIHSWLRQSSR